jgi:hypothetical protein
MWATLRAFEHNHLDRMTLIPAPKYGHSLLRSRARKTSISCHLIEEQRPESCGFHARAGWIAWTRKAGVL